MHNTQEQEEKDMHGRFKGAPWYSTDDTYALIGGAGGIGSWLALLLARAGFKPVVFDFDILEIHNLSGQLYGTDDIDTLKVDALAKMVKQFTGEEIQVFSEEYGEESITHNITFSAFDNMKAREIMFTKWKKDHGEDPEAIFIDGRLIMEQLTIFCVSGGNQESIKTYQEEHIFPDEDVPDGLCTMKQTSHSASMIASFMTAFFTNHITNVKTGMPVRKVPFETKYFIPINMFE